MGNIRKTKKFLKNNKHFNCILCKNKALISFLYLDFIEYHKRGITIKNKVYPIDSTIPYTRIKNIK